MFRFRCVIVGLAGLVLSSSSPCFAQQIKSLPELEGIETVEKRGEKVPRDLAFRRSNGATVPLGALIDGEMPVLLSLNYTRCPMLCGVQINGLIDGLRELSLEPGVDYRYLSVSIDPLESYLTAATQRDNFVAALGKPVAKDGVEFLTGTPEAIRDLARAVGFHYKYLKDKKQYVHPPVLISLSPDGLISRYFYSVKFDGHTLRLSLGEASDGKVSSVFDQILMTCFQYNAIEGRYTLVAWGVMRLAGIVTLIVLAGVLFPVWLKAARQGAAVEHGVALVNESDSDRNATSDTISAEKVDC